MGRRVTGKVTVTLRDGDAEGEEGEGRGDDGDDGCRRRPWPKRGTMLRRRAVPVTGTVRSTAAEGEDAGQGGGRQRRRGRPRC